MSGTGARLPYAFAKANGLLVKAVGPAEAEIFVRENAAPDALGELRRSLGRRLRLERVDVARFERLLADAYSGSDESTAELVDDMGQEVDLTRLVRELPPVADLLESADDAPMIRMINAIFMQALRERASDIHLEPFEKHSVVRFRIDGVLRDVVAPHGALHPAMVSRIKIMAQLDIAEKRLPQDGRIALRIGGKPVDVRVSTLPTRHGERAVLRLLDQDRTRLDLEVLGMAADTLNRIDDLVRRPHGILLVTGPTGSGKTTTLYAAISRLDTAALNVMTVEDPVEFDLHGIGQMQVNPRIDLSFSAALRSILRQDPDVIMIGEIRDAETAQIAVQASLTGHLVLATLHTNDAVSAVTRLMDMGIEPFLLSSTLSGVLAQRLVRCLCPHCRRPDDVGVLAAQARFANPPSTAYRAVGCPQCGPGGFRGRSGIFELLTIDDTLRRLIHARAGEAQLRQRALEAGGLRTLRDDGVRLLEAGATSLEELLRATSD